MGWSEWKNVGDFDKCILRVAGWKTASGSNDSAIDSYGYYDNEYFSYSNNSVTVLKPFEAMVYLYTRTASNSSVNTYGTLLKNNETILTTNDGNKSVGKSVSEKISFSAGDVLKLRQYANGTATTQTLFMFIQ